jgi:predicted DNA-binding WGR domain protein
MAKPELIAREVWLEAVDRERNIARRYSVFQTSDLFGHTIVEYAWARIGTRGQGRTVSFSHAQDADHFVSALLRRRAGAPKRIGVAYRECVVPR